MDERTDDPPRRPMAPARAVAARLGPDGMALLALAGAFVVLRVYALIHAKPVAYADTGSYADLDFFGGSVRTWGLPLLWKLVPGGATPDALAQVVIATGAWLFLATTVYRLANSRRVGVGGFALVLLAGLGPQITEWDMALLSESFTISLSVLLFAFAMLCVDRLTPMRAVGLGLTLCWWAAVRPSNFTILAVVVVPIAVILVLTRRRDVLLWVVVPMLLVAVWSGYIASRDTIIWPQNSIGVIQDRLLKDPEAKAFLHEHGMPRSALVEREKTKTYIGYDSPLSTDPEFMGWVVDEFQPVYIEWLVRHPVSTVGNPIKNAPELITNRTGYSAAMEVLPVTIKSVLWPDERDLPFLLIAVLALGLYALALTRSPSRLVIPLLGLAIGWMWIVVTWHLASPDLKRILAGASAVVHLSSVLIVIVAVDMLVTHRRRRLQGETGRTVDAGPSEKDAPVSGEPETAAPTAA